MGRFDASKLRGVPATRSTNLWPPEISQSDFSCYLPACLLRFSLRGQPIFLIGTRRLPISTKSHRFPRETSSHPCLPAPILRRPAVEDVLVLGFFDSVTLNQCTIFQRYTAMNIYVGNLAYSVTDADLREAFSRFGDVSQVNLIADKFSGQSKGFGFVEMDNNSEADAAIQGLNGTDMSGRSIKVNQAKPRAERPSRGPRY